MAEKEIQLSAAEAEAAEKLRIEMSNISGAQRAAVLMLLLGEQQASEIIKFLNPTEVQALGGAMVAVSDVSQEAVNEILDDFVATIKKQSSLGLGTTDYVEKVFKRALGDDKAASVLGRIMPGQSTKGLEILQWMDARAIADMIKTEHPQVTAIILSVLDHQVAADVLNFLPDETRPEIIQRVASLETVQPSAMQELEAIMKLQFSNNTSSKSSSFGGIKAAAQIMNSTKTALEASIMKGLEKIDADLMMRIQDNMFTFENLSAVDNKGIQVLMRAVDNNQLMIAMKGASEEVKARFFDNMSERARGMFKDEMDAKGLMRLSDVEEAQKQIMRSARKLSDSGELVLGGGDFV
ncbi:MULTISPECIES: flagellar motor switch protein FliG [unclassified Limnohabitans]|uniref:flagellar motor switch protein FliG n=1 Tax=unclassified Limnohabitans TaxID=2626134 RepID=UPI0006DC1569|nr:MULTISPECIES: flagellar motor switch protein FliG [unclassified Limnohabitans]ALK90932.1 Flagellar motor switch protein FliG [Limnohabitans sp. 103DPR2]PUE35488.1 flagellar motor switch protein FliG [Limnohabitans sp. Hippo4]